MIFLEFLIFILFVTIGIAILYFCCTAGTTQQLDEPHISIHASPQRQRRFLSSHVNKREDESPPVFCITSTSAMSRSNDHIENGFVDISIEELPPPYDDAFVIKPPKSIAVH